MTTYKSYIVNYINELVNTFGGVRKCAKIYGVDPGQLCKIMNGKLVPSVDSFNKLFGTNIKIETYVIDEADSQIINHKILEVINQKIESIDKLRKEIDVLKNDLKNQIEES